MLIEICEILNWMTLFNFRKRNITARNIKVRRSGKEYRSFMSDTRTKTL